jgi:hypothetical protein
MKQKHAALENTNATNQPLTAIYCPYIIAIYDKCHQLTNLTKTINQLSSIDA